MTVMKTPELLLPAGSLDKMRAAYDFGADAVYAGQPRYSLRARNNEFRLEQLQQGIDEARARGKKFYVTSNLLPHNDKVRTYLRDIEPVIAMRPDGLIMADPGLIMMVRETWPEVAVHLSVQANTVNHAAVKFWHRMGLKRIILSRELSLDEIAQIRQECPEIELEVFVHGALCIAYSGRCLLSGYFNRRDSNQGTCTNACRWSYKTHAGTDDTDTGEAQALRLEGDFNFEQEQGQAADSFSACGDVARHPLADRVYLLEESERPGELMPIMEDEHGTYIMNSKDLRAVEHVERLVRIGVDSLKVEGRTKSLYYVARVAQVYRRAIDDAAAGRAFNPDLLLQLEGLANRGYTGGFLERHPAQDYQNYITGHSEFQRSQFVGEVKALAGGWAEVEVKNRFQVGDTLEVIHPGGNQVLTLETMRDLEGEAIEVAPGSPWRVRIPLQERFAGALLARRLKAD
ncbi:MAG TPA: tRNA 5-hydroxyuridine modification protein YegQ [Aquabacterium sp.]|uniref:prephenate-dependent tRNA uridine(34) hydroxylase TrhP n=1 Tax=Aquabacterium sp. TaxID=1872578 RepID=UPI002DA17046|nr:tRNA 5-hydroxyuridine modification protein YegQ [Aquabacterium sp.]HET6788700.1 tRNA 5-hydroxyuridine modification protein YegQ [Aquabacterium sp.]HEX5373812.1 tRNA 5-hydroxyuridine modification protein YegQ [Aquabacterium sp.]